MTTSTTAASSIAPGTSPVHHHTRPTRRQARLLLGAALGLLLLGVLTDEVVASLLHVHVHDMVQAIRGRGAAAPLVLIVLLVVAIVVPPVPSVPLDIAAGIVFGISWGTIWVLVGAEIGALAAFAIARRLGRERVARRIDPARLAQLDALVERRGTTAIFVMRLVPAFQFDWVSYAAGLSSMRPLPYAMATLIGMTPPVVAIVAVGDCIETEPAVAAAIFGVLLALALALAPLVWWSAVERRPRSLD